MGFTRKMMSVGSFGLVDFRSDKERTAAYTKGVRKQARLQTAAMCRQAHAAHQAARAQQAMAAQQQWIAQQQWAAQQPQLSHQQRLAHRAAVGQQSAGSLAAPGWYHDGQSLRWWDGRQWTEHRA